jgi:translation initiation factor 5
MINIKRVDDVHFRYKMPKLIIKQETTHLKILNLSDVAKSLHTKPKYIIKYFGYELGTSSNYSSSDSFGTLNGEYTFLQIENLLYKFIDKFILCYQCLLPETYLKLNSDSTKLRMKCNSCGFRKSIKDHKLVNYIINDL